MGPGRIKNSMLSAGSFARRLKRDLSDNRKKIKTAAVILVILTAVFVFWRNGEKTPIGLIDTEGSSIAFAGEREIKQQKPEVMAKGETEGSLVFCDIGGAVNEPGVYGLPEGSRLCDLIEEAGGLSDDADISCVNRALVMTDGAMVRIPFIGEIDQTSSNAFLYSSGQETYMSFYEDSDSGAGLININTAGPEELQLIPGVGPAIAGRIIEYREDHGQFQSIEEIKNVKGIGDKTLEKIKDHICC